MTDTGTKRGWLRLLSLDILIAMVFCLASLIVFVFVANEIVLENRDLFDSRAFRFFEQHTTEANTRLARNITFFGGGYWLFPFYLVIIAVLWLKRKRNYAIITAAIALASFLLTAVLKNVFQRERPSLEHLDVVGGYSFPSGHSLAIFTFAGLMMYLLWHTALPVFVRLLGCIVLFLFACLVGVTRIYLHVHYASDVLGGFCVTGIWLGACYIYFHWGNKKWLV